MKRKHIKEGNKLLMQTNFRFSEIQEIVQNQPVLGEPEKETDSELENETTSKNSEAIVDEFVMLLLG